MDHEKSGHKNDGRLSNADMEMNEENQLVGAWFEWSDWNNFRRKSL